MSMDKIEQLRKEVVRVAQKIRSKGLVEDGEGNTSVRLNKNEILATPTSTNYDQLTPEKIVHMDLDGNVLNPGVMASTEIKMHLGVYRDRPKAGCVMHTHSPYVSMLSVLRKNIPIIMEQQVIFLGGEIQCTKMTQAHTAEMGTNAIEALGMNNAAILANHGAIICAKSVDLAVREAVFLEKMGKIYWGALQTREPIFVIPDENVEHFFKTMFNPIFACYPRRLKKK